MVVLTHEQATGSRAIRLTLGVAAAVSLHCQGPNPLYRPLDGAIARDGCRVVAAICNPAASTAFVGDRIRLDGTCTGVAGTPVRWRIEGQGAAQLSTIGSTILPGDDAPVVDAQPELPGPYRATLLVAGEPDFCGATVTFEAIGFTAVLASVRAANTVRGIAADARLVYLATPAAGWIVDSDTLGAQSVESIAGAPFPAQNLSAVVLARGAAFFGGDQAPGAIVRADVAPDRTSAALTLLDNPDASDYSVHAMSADADGTVVAATSTGLLRLNPADRTVRFGPAGSYWATGVGRTEGSRRGRIWAALSDRMINLSLDGGTPFAGGAFFDVFGGNGNKRAIAVGEQDSYALRLWVGGLSDGIEVADLGALATDPATSLLVPLRADSGFQVRAIALDARGGAWVATDRGLKRYDRDGRFSFAYGPAEGLPTSNLLAVTTFDDPASGTRSVWVGTAGFGVAVLRVP